MKMEFFFISSPIGTLQVVLKETKLYSVSGLHTKKTPRALKRLAAKNKDQNVSYVTDTIGNFTKNLKTQKLSKTALSIRTQLKNYFQGRLKKFNISLHKRGTDFQQKVWKTLQIIPFGKTKSYGEIATKLQSKGARAIGNCCAANPFLIIVPCHRVTSKKTPGGFALGLKAKKELLSLEGIYTF